MIDLETVKRLRSTRLSTDQYFSRVGRGPAAERDYMSQITVGKPGSCPNQPLLLMNLFDNSASVVGGADPVGQRFPEAGLAVERVGVRCRCKRDLVATIPFDTPTSLDLKPTPITRPHFAEIRNSLAVPPDGAGVSLLGPSLRVADQMASQHPDHRAVLVIYSDFQLFDNDLAGLYDDLIAFPGDVHAVVFRATPPDVLLAAESVTVTPVSYASPPGTVSRAVFRAITSTRPGARALLPEGAS